MNIWIDGYEANVNQRLGSGQVAAGLLKALYEKKKKNSYTICLPNDPTVDLPKERENWKYKILKPKILWSKISLPFALFREKQKPDLIFSPTHYIPQFSPVKRIGMIFDLSFLHYPESFVKKDLYQLKIGSKFSIYNASHIITISNFSKKDILKNYAVSKDKITVAYPGFDRSVFKKVPQEVVSKVLEKFQVNGSYIVFIGTLQPRKNLIRLIEAVSKIKNLNLVVIGKFKGEGKEGWMYDEILERPKKLNIDSRVIFTGYIPNDEVVALLNGATCFILPSLWEGFGIPVVEAFACGTPVIVSNVSSLPEVVGKAGLLVDPKSQDQIEQAIRVYLSDKKLRSKMIKLGTEQVKKYSWEKMAKKVVEVFEKTK